MEELGGPVLQFQATVPACVEFIPPDSDVQALRLTPHLFGAGLVEAVSDATLLELAAATRLKVHGEGDPRVAETRRKLESLRKLLEIEGLVVADPSERVSGRADRDSKTSASPRTENLTDGPVRENSDASLPPIPERLSIVVLDFHNEANDPALSYLSRGLRRLLRSCDPSWRVRDRGRSPRRS